MTIHVYHQAPRTRPPAALIAQAPGYVEERVELSRRNKGQRGFPLAGPSSFALTRAVEYGFRNRSRWDYLIDNVYDRRILNDDLSTLCTSRPAEEDGFADEFTRHVMGKKVPGGKGYLTAEGWGQLSRLYHNIRKYDPPILIALGGFATFALTGRNLPLSTHRGVLTYSHLTRPDGSPYPLIPSYHPSPRNARNSPLIMFDLMKAERFASGELPLPMPDRFVHIIEREEDLRGALSLLRKEALVSVDIETTIGRGFIKSVQLAGSSNEAYCVPLFHPQVGAYHSIGVHFNLVAQLRDFLEQATPLKLFQNGPFDTQWLYEAWGVRTMGYRYDTKLMSHTLFTELPRDLGTLGANFAHEIAWKSLSGDTSEGKDDD